MTAGLFVADGSGWGENLRMYAWGSDLPELYGGWPGSAASAKTTLGGKEWKVFPFAESLVGNTYNPIPNNKVSGVEEADQKQYDGPAFVAEGLVFMSITASEAKIEDAPKLRIVIDDKTGWGENLRLYAWGSDLPELFGGWPGAAPEIVGDVLCFEIDLSEHYGQTYNLIPNNKVSGVDEADQVQYDGPAITLNRDYTITITASEATVVE